MIVLRLILVPIALIYGLLMRVRNYIYNRGLKPSYTFEIPVISVGNLNAGGSGKTPMVEYLIRLLFEKYAVATLSRGYKRKSSGFRMAGDKDSAISIGDEPFQIYRKFQNEIKVFVGENRKFAMDRILEEFPKTKVILLDDAFQHRAVKPAFSILVTEFENPFYLDQMLPAGRLREPRTGVKRADLIVVTKCANTLSESAMREVTLQIEKYAGNKPVFFSSIKYDTPVSLNPGKTWSGNIVLITGIANDKPVLDYCSSNFRVLKHFRFRDHHNYTLSDWNEIVRFCKMIDTDYSVLTTEKDMVRLINKESSVVTDQLPLFYIPIRHVFLRDGLKFDDLVRNAVSGIRKP